MAAGAVALNVDLRVALARELIVEIAPSEKTARALAGLEEIAREIAAARTFEVRLQSVADALFGMAAQDFTRRPALLDDGSVLDAVVACVNMLSEELSAYVDERGRIEAELERRVLDRTAELQRELAERTRAEEALRRTEEHLRQALKMEAVGRLAGGIAHDFNNVLAVIIADAQLAMTELPPEHSVCTSLMEIESAAQRAATLTRQLLLFSRKQTCQPEILALNSVITNLEKMLCRIVGEDLEVVASLDSRLGAVEADPSQIEQVVINLVVNARDAMPAGGKLSIETTNVELDAERANEIGIRPGPYVMLAVSDTGTGMDAATQSRIFEPFFTTKEVGKGTGLGLSTVFGIVTQACGGISVSSEVGRGSTFRIYLPRVDARAPVVEAATATSPAAPRGKETVLVVEDEDGVRRVVKKILVSRGYRVLEAPNGRAALQLLRERGDCVDLVVTDLVMPDMDGRTMAAKLLEARPQMKVLYMSGYTEHAAMRGSQLGPTDFFVQKPFTVQEMALAVRRALEGRRTSSSAALHAVRSVMPARTG